MFLLRHLCRVLFCLSLFAGCLHNAHADVITYAHTPDPVFSWKLNSKKEVAGGTVYDLHLVSQVWEGITWEHQLQVYLPTGVKPTATMFLWNQGGKANAGSMALGMELARR